MSWLKNDFGEWREWVSLVGWYGAMLLILTIGWLVITGCTLKLATPAPPILPPGAPMPEVADQADWLWAIGYPVLLAAVGWLKRRELSARAERNKIERCAKLLIGAIESQDAKGVKELVSLHGDEWINEAVRTIRGVVQPTRPFPPPPPQTKGET